MRYIDLIDLGFERFEMGDGFDMLGFYDFYLYLKISKDITFEWNWQKEKIVKMVRYEDHDVQNYIEITDLATLKSLLYLYMEKQGNSGTKPMIGTVVSNRTMLA